MRITKITIECRHRLDSSETLEDYVGFAEEVLMVNVMAGAVGLLQALPQIRDHIELIRFTLSKNSETLNQNAIEVNFRIIILATIEGNPKIESQESLYVLRDPSYWKLSDTIITIDRLASSIIAQGGRSVRGSIRGMLQDLERQGRALQVFAPFAFPQSKDT